MKVDSNVPKVHKIPVEMRMLTFDEDETSRRLSISSSTDPIDKRAQSQESFDTDGPTVYHNLNKSENVYKPFRQQTDNKLPNAFRESKNNNTEILSPKKDNQSDHNSFFMTQVSYKPSYLCEF